MNLVLTEPDSRLFDTLVECSDRVFFYYADLKSNVARWSKYAVEYFGLPGEILSPSTLWDAKVHPDDFADYQKTFIQMADHVTPYHNCEYRVTIASGEYVWVHCRGYMNYDKEGNPEFFAGYVMNMGTINKVDQVTGLWTSYGFRSDVSKMLERGLRGAAMLFDINNFKQINSNYGYEFGDKVLRTIGGELVKIEGNKVHAYRMDGAQFAVCMEGTEKDLAACEKVLVQKLEKMVIDGVLIHLEYSIGAVVFPKDGEGVDQIQSNLFYSLSYAKQLKSRDMIFFNKDLYEKRSRRVRLNEALMRSIDEGFQGFRIVLQPVIDAKTGRLHSAEVLLRWCNEEFPKAGPMDFVPILEETHKIIPVGRWIIDQALSCVAKWNRMHGASKLPHININFSYIQLIDPALKDYVIGKLDEYYLPHDTLVAELTESCRIEYNESLGEILQSYHDAGILIALDDFGTGYASLTVLKEIPADIVKLDYTMIRTVVDRPKDRTLVEFIITYCAKMQIDVCTEGVETEQALGIVKDAGATFIQGYYYDRPLETKDFYEKYICGQAAVS